MHVFGILTITLLYKHNASDAERVFVRPLESDELSELYQRNEKLPN